MKVREAITELEETKLYVQLFSLSKDYAERIKTFVKGIEPLMASIKNYFPFYTRHDVHHGYQVVSRMEQCLIDSCFDSTQPEALTEQEIFLLIASAYAHDLGMAVFPEEEELLKEKLGLTSKDAWETSEILQSHLRHNHSSRGGKYIEQNAEHLGVPRNLVAALDLMMQAHNFSIPQLENKLDRPFAAGHKECDLAQLAVIVCVADAIEFSDTRVVDGVLEQLSMDQSPAARISYAENMKHVCTGDSLAVTQDGRIIVSGTFADANILALAHRTFDQMQEWIQGYSDIDCRAKYKRLKVRGEAFQRDLAFSGGEFHRLGVRLNKRSVIDLIASNAVWHSDQGIALRELVQNSVEACRYREHHSAPSDKYSPEVRIMFNRQNHSVSVSDNGCGMSERTVLNNFLTVGSSRSCEATYTESDYAPIARFGIGFWSVFTISEVATVSTAAFENYRGKPSEAQYAQGFEFKVQLTELKDFTVFSPIERACGTSVSLKLKPEVIIDDVYLALKSQLLCSMVPLILELDGTEERFKSDPPDVNAETLHGVRRQKAESLGIKVFQHRGETEQTSLSLGMAYRMENGKATFMAEPDIPMASVIERLFKQQSAICGFSVPTRLSPLCIDLLRVGTYNANSMTPKGFEFSIDRQQLNSNAAATLFMDDIRRLIHEGYRSFLQTTDSYHPKTIYTLQMEAASNGGNVYDAFTGSELSIARENYPDLICSKLVPVNSTLLFSEANAKAKFLNITELSETDGIAFCLQAQRNFSSYGPRIHFYLETEAALSIAYQIVQNYINEVPPGVPVYLMPPDRNFSMLFDNDPSASVRVVTLREQLEICLLNVNLDNINYQEESTDVVSEIRGPWSGTIYWREFSTPDNKPYLFLGRHRVLIDPRSNLYSHIKQLTDNKRYAQAAKTIYLLQEDEAGHVPDALRSYL